MVNNGNVMQSANNITPERRQRFAGVYPERSRRDELNRRISGQSQAASGTRTWGQTYDYRIWADLYWRLGNERPYSKETGATAAELIPDAT